MAGRRIRNWLISLVIVGGLAAIAVPNFLRARERSRATTILNDARILDKAIEQWAAEKGATPETKVEWKDVSIYLKPGTRLRESNGTDLWGNPFLIGPTRKDGVKFSPDTLRRYDSSVVPATFWEQFQ